MPDFRAAATEYFHRGWLTIPLMRDADGLPKRPMTLDWPNLKRDEQTLDLLPWENAAGMGLVLGPVSGNIGALDLDDQELARAAALWLDIHKPSVRYHWTARRRLHVLVQEPRVTRSHPLKVSWQGRSFGVELKSVGTQIAIPPTPPYEQAGGPDPWQASLPAAWATLANALGVTFAASATSDATAAGYPKPWLDTVPEGERNKAIYVEACRLREARVPLGEAMELLKLRIARAYAGVVPEGDAMKTVRSAYRKGTKPERRRFYGAVM